MPNEAHDVDGFTRALLRFIETRLLEREPGTIDADRYLFDTGLIDSLKILQLIAFVEDWTGRPIPEPDIVMKHFRTVRAIADRFVAHRRPSPPAPLARSAP